VLGIGDYPELARFPTLGSGRNGWFVANGARLAPGRARPKEHDLARLRQ